MKTYSFPVVIENTRRENRRYQERRDLSWWTFAYGACCGKREAERRRDRDPGYVDRYDRVLFLVSVGIFALGCVDAQLTLLLLRAGATELNPLLELALRVDLKLFLWIKFTLTALGLIILVVHKNFRVFSYFCGQSVMYFILAIYLGLVSYESVLLLH